MSNSQNIQNSVVIINGEQNINLSTYLKQIRVIDSKKPFNFTTSYSTDGIPRGKFLISKEEIDRFINIYYNHVFIKKNKSTLLERPFSESNRPYFKDGSKSSNLIKIDLDMRFNLLADEKKSGKLIRKYDISQINQFIVSYLEKLKNYVTFPDDMRVYLMEKKKPTIKNLNNCDIKKDGIHIMIPGYLTPNTILHKVRDEMVEDTDIQELFQSIDSINTITDIVDECVINRNSWFLYGSGKANDYNYYVTHCYKINDLDDSIELDEVEIASNKELIRCLSNLCVCKNINIKNNVNITKNIQNNSAKYNNESLDDVFKNLDSTQNRRPISKIHPDTIESLVECISPKRAADFSDWWKIGLILFNIHFKNDRIWKDFSKQCPEKYDERACNEYWIKFQQLPKEYHNLGISHLKGMAFKDNPAKMKEKYEKQTTRSLEIIINNLRFEKKCPATTFAEYTKDYINSHENKHINCVHDDKNHITWFYYSDNHWKEDKGAIYLKKFLMNDYIKSFKEISRRFGRMEIDIRQNIDSLNNRSETDSSYDDRRDVQTSRANMMADNQRYEDLSKTAKLISQWLEVKSTRDNIISDMAVWYNSDSFYQELDTNPDIFVCKNGVLDLSTCEFRQGIPDDKMMRYSNIDYITMEEIQDSSIYSERFDKLQEFLDKIFPNYDLQTYFLNQIGECLDGHQHRQELIICTGTGSNGKSKIFELLEKVFGDYAIKTNPSLLTKVRGDANTATPALADLRGKRLAFCEEPNETETIKTGIMKGLTGGDSITARQLHKPNITFSPQHKLFLSCNDKPDIESTDDGTWRRIKTIPYESKFCDTQDPKLDDWNKYPNHFEKEDVDIQFNDWAPILLAMLFDKYKILKKNKFIYPETECIKEANLEYMAQQNIFHAFVNDKLVKKSGEKCDISEVFQSFLAWTRQSNNKSKTVSKHIFETNMNRILGKHKNKKWKGYLLSDYIAEESNDEQVDSEDESDGE